MPISPRSVFGVRLRAARQRAGLPQDRLGVMIGIDEGSSSARISRYESGIHAVPIEIAAKIADVLRVPLPYFFCLSDASAALLLETQGLSEAEMERLLRAAKRIKGKAIKK